MARAVIEYATFTKDFSTGAEQIQGCTLRMSKTGYKGALYSKLRPLRDGGDQKILTKFWRNLMYIVNNTILQWIRDVLYNA